MARATTTKTNSINQCSTLIYRMVNQEGNVKTIFKTLSKTFCRHFETFSKFFAISLAFVEFFEITQLFVATWTDDGLLFTF